MSIDSGPDKKSGFTQFSELLERWFEEKLPEKADACRELHRARRESKFTSSDETLAQLDKDVEEATNPDIIHGRFEG